MGMSDMLLPELDKEMAVTRETLERVPEDKLDWQPHPKSWTMGKLVTHMAGMLGWVKPTMDAASLDLAGMDNPDGDPVTSREELLSRFDDNLAQAREAVASASDEEWMTPWTLTTGDTTHFTMPRAAVIRGMIMNHMIHHRAQLGVYLRLNDVPLPATYGPSADEGTM